MPAHVLVAGGWREARLPAGSFRPVDPASGEPLPEEFPISSWPDVEEALQAGAEAADGLLGAGPDRIAGYLEALAAGLEGRA